MGKHPVDGFPAGGTAPRGTDRQGGCGAIVTNQGEGAAFLLIVEDPQLGKYLRERDFSGQTGINEIADFRGDALAFQQRLQVADGGEIDVFENKLHTRNMDEETGAGSFVRP